MVMSAQNPTQSEFLSGEVVASFDTYLGAQRAVDFLSDEGFPVENLWIVGSDLKQVEKVTGRLNSWKAALAGAGSLAWVGLFVGIIVSLFANSTSAVFLIIISGVLYGALFGAIFGFVAHAFTRGQRDFASVSTTVATRYDVYCTPSMAARAREMLSRLTAGGAPTT
jgi:heat induced stress protein YflT